MTKYNDFDLDVQKVNIDVNQIMRPISQHNYNDSICYCPTRLALSVYDYKFY